MRVAVFAERDNDGDLRLQQPEVYGGGYGLRPMAYAVPLPVCNCVGKRRIYRRCLLPRMVAFFPPYITPFLRPFPLCLINTF